MNITKSTICVFLTFFISNILAQNITGVSADSILFGQSAAFKGRSSSLGSELWRGSQAYFNYINAQGGVHGRKIKIISLDDSYDGNKTILNTIQLVKQEKVFALFGYVGTPTLVKALPVLQKFSHQDLILFASFTGAQIQRLPPNKKNVFNIRSSYKQETAAIINQLVKLGHSKFGTFIQQDSYGRSGLDGVTAALKKHQLTVLAQTSYKRGAPFNQSMLEQYNILKQKNVQAIISIGSYAASAAFIRDARLAGFNGPIANVSFVGSDSMLRLLKIAQKKHKIPLSNKLINTQVVPPWNDRSIPLVKNYQNIMQKYASELPAELKDEDYTPLTYSFVSLEGFLNAKVLVKALQLTPKEMTRKSFIQSIESINNMDIGIKKKLNFSTQNHQGLDAVYFTTVSAGQYKIINQWDIFRP